MKFFFKFRFKTNKFRTNFLRILQFKQFFHLFPFNFSHFQGEEDGPDIAVLITTIREDPIIQENGAICLLEALLLSFIASANYDSRYRVLLRHLATLLGISWDDFEEVLLLYLVKHNFTAGRVSCYFNPRGAIRRIRVSSFFFSGSLNFLVTVIVI